MAISTKCKRCQDYSIRKYASFNLDKDRSVNDPSISSLAKLLLVFQGIEEPFTILTLDKMTYHLCIRYKSITLPSSFTYFPLYQRKYEKHPLY